MVTVSLQGVRRLLVVVAHPDDESLAAGGLLHLAGRSGIASVLLVATDGEASHPASPTHSATALAQRRRAELDRAVATLDPSARVERLGLPDSGLTGHADELAGAIADRLTDVDLVVSNWCGDGHPDHEVVGRTVLAVAPGIEGWQAPIWARQWPELREVWPQGRDVVEFPLDESARQAKAAAISAHVSQVQPLSDEPGDERLLSEEMLALFRTDQETFVRYRAGR